MGKDGTPGSLSSSRLGKVFGSRLRCIGTKHPEIIYYPHPVFAHTSPVYVQYRDERIEKSESAGYLLEFMRRLESWAREEAYFGNEGKKEEALSTIRRGMDFYRRIAGQPGT